MTTCVHSSLYNASPYTSSLGDPCSDTTREEKISQFEQLADRVREIPTGNWTESMRNFMRMFIAFQAEMNQLALTLSLNALEAKIAELKESADSILQDAEKMLEADIDRGSTGMVSGVIQGASAGCSGVMGGKAKTQELAAKNHYQAARASGVDALQRGLIRNDAITCTQASIKLSQWSAISRAGGEFAGALVQSSGTLSGAAAAHEGAGFRADQKRNDADAAQADSQFTSASQFIQQNQQAASSQLQQYQEFLREMNQMEKTAFHVA